MCTSPMLMYYNLKERKFQINDSPDCDINRAIWVSCGKCYECKKARKSNYTVRARAEYSKYGAQRCFLLNLTVNDFCIERVFPNGQLDHTEFQKFMKRFRKKLETHVSKGIKIKYICGAEYGEDNGRPHFHVIVYGWKPGDLKRWTSSQKGFKQYRSQFIEECWRDVEIEKDKKALKKQLKEFKEKYPNMKKANGEDYDYIPLGMVTLGEVYESTVSYVTKYVVKNFDIPKEEYFDDETGEIIRKPYVVFPREMLGYQWFLENYKNLLRLGYCTTKYGKCAIPKNWINKALESDDEELVKAVELYQNEREIYFAEVYRDLYNQGYTTKISMYYKVFEEGKERRESYKNWQRQNTNFVKKI